MNIIEFETLESKLITYKNQLVLIDSDVADLYGVKTKEINQAVQNNLSKFPDGYLEVVKSFDHLSKLKYSPHLPKIFTEKGLYMLATILKGEVATQTTIKIIETFANIKKLSHL
ncbi:MAG: ORF6N domain-containing protein, partial [Campylobacterota bacterium]|nr:ORF6N domain-containing protein [Campylobacterota bacterium]